MKYLVPIDDKKNFVKPCGRPRWKKWRVNLALDKGGFLVWVAVWF
jgi:hypothetical protein